MVKILLYTCVCLWLVVVKAVAAPALLSESPLSAEQWLQQMQQKASKLTYQFYYVTTNQGRSEPVRLDHVTQDGKSALQVNFLNGPERLYILRDGAVSFFEPEHRPYTLSHTRIPDLLPTFLMAPLKDILLSYQALLAGESRVAGRSTEVVRLVAKNRDKYSYVLWLDRETGLLLRVDVLSLRGLLVGQYLGVELKRYQQPNEQLKKLLTMKLPQPFKASEVYQAPQQKLNWKVGWMPQGFKIVSSDRHRLVGVNQNVDYMMATDGLVQLSIYVASNTERHGPPQQLARLGSVNLFSYANNQGMDITVIGLIPAPIAQRIAESVVVSKSKTNPSLPQKSPKALSAAVPLEKK